MIKKFTYSYFSPGYKLEKGTPYGDLESFEFDCDEFINPSLIKDIKLEDQVDRVEIEFWEDQVFREVHDDCFMLDIIYTNSKKFLKFKTRGGRQEFLDKLTGY